MRSRKPDLVTIPLFPLHSVIFPGGRLPLRIFEPRYLDMISRCMRDESGFGIVLINEGREVGEAASVFEVGTYCNVTYFHQRSDGLLGITAEGQQRFRIVNRYVNPNQLVMAEVVMLPEIAPAPIPSKLDHLVKRLDRILKEMDHPYVTMQRRFDDAAWVGGRLIEFLPLSLPVKQRLLSQDDPLVRLTELEQLLDVDGLLEE